MAKIIKVSGPTVQASGIAYSFMHEVVEVGPEKLLGEIILIKEGVATIQVYEDTLGLKIGDNVKPSGELMAVELGPGLIGSIFDGIQRPLPQLADKWGDYIGRGAILPSLDRKRKWHFAPSAKPGDTVSPGMVIGIVRETTRILHKIMVPKGLSGVIEKISEGEFAVEDVVATLNDGSELTLLQKRDIREQAETAGKLPLSHPMITGQRILDSLFPVAEGGTAIIPGGFGTGKTVLEQTIAKYADADIIIYIGCGERGNEMADVLNEFPELKDPHTGNSLMERTILIANTSNMPVAAREASIYTGISIAEYFRDMGYKVAVMADSTSRWAEALREISSRMEEMPGEEGYPPYLASRLGSFYERSGKVKCLGRPDETGSITVIGAVSPPGGDFSEPVTQASMRMASAYWALDYDLAHQRHFPAISWLSSFSLSYPAILKWFQRNLDEAWGEKLAEVNSILQKEVELQEMVKIIGMDAMGEGEQLDLEGGRIIREGYLRQSSYHEVDAYCDLKKQKAMLDLQLSFISEMKKAFKDGVSIEDVLAVPAKEELLRIKELPAGDIEGAGEKIFEELRQYFKERVK